MTVKVPIRRDEAVEAHFELAIEAAAAFYDGDAEMLSIVGEVVATSELPIDEYREIQAVVFDRSGGIIGRGYTNWGEFGLRQSFALGLSSSELFGKPAEVKLFPSTG